MGSYSDASTVTIGYQRGEGNVDSSRSSAVLHTTIQGEAKTALF